MQEGMESAVVDFPMPLLEAVKFDLLNCSFFHRPPKSFVQICGLLEKDGDFLIQDSKGPKLQLSIRSSAKIWDFSIALTQDQAKLHFVFAKNGFDSLEELVFFFSKQHGKNYIEIDHQAGEPQFQLCRPIYRENYAGRLGYGQCLRVRDSVRRGKIHSSFVRSLRVEFAVSKEIEEDLEKLVTLDHRNLVRLLDFSLLLVPSRKSPLVFLNFAQIQSARSLFDRLFNQNDPLSSRRYIKWAYQAATGLNYLMDRGILHRRLNARACLLDSMENLRLSDFWTDHDPGDLRLFAAKANIPPTISQSTILYRDGWRYLPAETLLNGHFDGISQVWTYALLVWQIYTHCQFGNRIFFASLSEFLSVTSGRDDPFHLPGHLTQCEAQQGMPEERRRKQIFLKASERLPHAPESLGQIIPKALLPDRSRRPYFSELLRIVESEKRILDMANVLGFFL